MASLFLILLTVGITLGSAYIVYILIEKERKLRSELLEKNTQLQHAQMDLRQSEEQFKQKLDAQTTTAAISQQIISELQSGVICISQNGTIQLINAYAHQFIDMIDPVGQSYQQVVRCRVGESTVDYTPFTTAFNGKMVTIPEKYSIVCQRGVFPIRGTVIPLRKEGVVEAVVFVFKDSREQLARTDEEKAFFSAAAHELRTPLSIIRANVSLIREYFDTLEKDKIKELLSSTDETTVQLINLVNDFLNISRIDQGRLDVKKEQFDMVKLAAEVVMEQLPLVKEHKLFLNHKIADEPVYLVMGDRTKAREVLTNLVSNALKYTIVGGVTVSHSVINSHLATKVSDTGNGIASQSLRLLFQRFQQVGMARNQSTQKSTGLGLYISKKLAQLMGGDVVLEASEPGKGSTFTFILPRVLE